LALEGFDKRIRKDRRRQPTPGLNRYILFGQRKGLRRRIDQEKGGYVDRYSSGLFFILVLIIGLNVLDALLTMMILELGGRELNPVVQSVMDLCGEKFWVWKFAVVSLSMVLLCLHSRFKRVMAVCIGSGFIYLAVMLYQIFLIAHQ
jgi:Domain of unknown function (DUF5658)